MSALVDLTAEERALLIEGDIVAIRARRALAEQERRERRRVSPYGA